LNFNFRPLFCRQLLPQPDYTPCEGSRLSLSLFPKGRYKALTAFSGHPRLRVATSRSVMSFRRTLRASLTRQCLGAVPQVLPPRPRPLFEVPILRFFPVVFPLRGPGFAFSSSPKTPLFLLPPDFFHTSPLWLFFGLFYPTPQLGVFVSTEQGNRYYGLPWLA